MSTTPPRKRASAPAHAHKASWVALVIAVLGVVSQILNVFGPDQPSRHTIAKTAAPIAKQQAQAALKKATVRLVNQAANAPAPPNQTCSVPVGQGTMGACSPSTELPRGLVGAVANAASATQTVHGKIGVDTSSFQSCQVAPRWLSFWIVKGTEGTGYRDRCTAKNVADAKRQHQVCGIYDFMRATGSYAGAEAGTFVSYTRATGASKCIHVLDVEANNLHLSATTLHAYVCSWVDTVRHAFPGQPVVIYTGNWFWGPSVGGNTCGGTVLWDSAYASYAQLPGTWGGGFLSFDGWAPYVGQRGRYRASTPLWQYSDGVYGPHPRVNRWDTDAFFGSRAQLERLAGAPAQRPCSKRTACRMGRRHAHVHQTIAKKCNPASNRRHHPIVCLRLHNRNEYMHRYARRHHLTLVTR